MKIILNGKPEELTNGMTIKGLLELKGLADFPVIAVLNSEVVQRGDWDNFTVHENDHVDFVRIVGGG